ncbi:NAD(P)-binding protein [Atractiella rhizophila]|nr:NAD(P)-binding protein [Atractiella rhizophila]
MSRVFVVTGASRGIGLAWIELLSSSTTNKVFALARNPSNALRKLEGLGKGRVQVVTADVADEGSILNAVEEIQKMTSHIDVLINNAGVTPGGIGPAAFTDTTASNILEAVRVNTIGPILTTKAFIPLLRKGKEKKVTFTGSVFASLKLVEATDIGGGSGTNGDYALSKVALHMAARKLDIQFKKEGFSMIAIHPGWVRTDMGGDGPLSPLESVTRQLAIIDKLKPEETDKLFACDQESGELSW